MEPRDLHVGHLRAAEAQFRLATAVRLAVTVGHQPLDLPIQWAHGKHTVNYSEIALSREEADFAAWNLQRSATFLMASAALEVIRGAVANPRLHPDPQVVSAYQIARMIRNAFSHRPFDPVWRIDSDCSDKRFALQGVMELDCTGLDGKPFDWRDYGGPLALLGLSRFVRCNLIGDSNDEEAVPLPERVYYQQGDLLLVKLEKPPADAVPTEVERLPGGGIPLPGGHVVVPTDKE
jgi:hypothetical protein